ncbi:hypothetical protein KP509_28G045800 [Ceratopteris richardii]|uniref:EF-hand domain-containing protein n=1 Tax=Ceratopteris richardii TaxID=49495 RepID=A0A8T2RDJ2_CERRI|nr:hypothetical protein KP509_28G045800 [Ceratopteris richardii]
MSHPGDGYHTKPTAPPAPQPWQQQGNFPPHGSFHGSGPYAHPPPSSVPYGPPGSAPWPAPSYPSSTHPYGGYPPQQPYGSTFMKASFPPGTDPEIVSTFQAADRDGSGLIDEYELQRTLSVTQPFSLRTVRLMIHLFGSKDSKRIGPTEFIALWKALKEWKSVFERFDRDRSGSVDRNEMREALMSLGYAISPPILDCLLQKYDRTGQGKAMDYDSFIESGLIIRGLTERFKQQDVHLRGSATLDYQTFMLMVLPFIVA